MSEASAPAQRIVPGAPPPPPPSKSQKKKRKTAKTNKSSDDGHVDIPDPKSAALVEQAPKADDVAEGHVAPQLTVQPSESVAGPATPLAEGSHKASPLVDMLNKRIKATNKKITRIQSYSTTPVEKLNDDQKRSLKTLPILEGIHKELEEVRRAVEQHEAEHAQELLFKQQELERAQVQRIKEAVTAAESAQRRLVVDLLSFIRLHSHLVGGHPAALALNLSDLEGSAVLAANEVLFGEDLQSRADFIDGFFSSEGLFRDVSFSRLLEIVQLFMNPPQPPTPEPEPAASLVHEEPTPVPDLSVGGLPSAIGNSGSFRFVVDDELEAEEQNPEPALEQSTEWVHVHGEETGPVQSAEVEVSETITAVEVNGHTLVEDTVAVTTTTEVPEPAANQAINWADEDEGGLPSIGSLHARFGSTEESQESPGVSTPTVGENVSGPSAPAEEDGFTATAPRARGRGRGQHRGERGGHRGGLRGGERGSFRGGDRGFRGGHRGGERGGYRGRPNGDWRGADGEFRGRGRGRGRGGFQEGRGAAVAASS
ncbi:hypothetical protein K474DRAFT_1655725 [Panus rudis PR-1116 ss-1]|nr:hypothetical protein K474DRAFT_1655725 [Panus rudis PR-1116 ss-1]